MMGQGQDGAFSRLKVGQLGEQMARDYLLQQGHRIVELNWRCRTGEIDIISQINTILVFTEVRTRQNKHHFGLAVESVNYRKQEKVRATARVYIHHNRKHDHMIRFDVIAILLHANSEVEKIEHIIDAF